MYVYVCVYKWGIDERRTIKITKEASKRCIYIEQSKWSNNLKLSIVLSICMLWNVKSVCAQYIHVSKHAVNVLICIGEPCVLYCIVCCACMSICVLLTVRVHAYSRICLCCCCCCLFSAVTHTLFDVIQSSLLLMLNETSMSVDRAFHNVCIHIY